LTEEDIKCSKEEIEAKYPKGSPDYPSHAKGCACSGCWASWGEWRSAHMGFSLGVMAAAKLIENHSCVSSCCDAQPSAGEAKALALCVLNLVRTERDT
jgi:hypothetical protein